MNKDNKNTELNNMDKKLHISDVIGSLPIEEISLHSADDWYENAKFRSDIKADLYSYYEGFRDAMKFIEDKLKQ